jgi:hypothetical protein
MSMETIGLDVCKVGGYINKSQDTQEEATDRERRAVVDTTFTIKTNIVYVDVNVAVNTMSLRCSIPMTKRI